MNEAKAARYQRLRRRADVVSAGAGAAVLALAALTPAGRAVADWVTAEIPLAPGPWRALAEVAAFVALLAAALEVIALPVVMWLGLRLDRRFKRGEKSLGSLVLAQLHVAATGVAITVLAAVVVHLSARIGGEWWWLVGGAVLSACLAAAVRGVSTLIARTAAAGQLQGTALTARLAQVSTEAAVPIAGIYEWRDHGHDAHTASVTGFGRGRRVLIAPEVLRDWSQDEIAVVVAHELAHHRHHDLVQALTLDALLVASALAASDLALTANGSRPSDLLSLPLIALVAGTIWTLATPARHALSRWQERRADQFALAVTGQHEAFATAVRRLGAQHLAEERPSRLTRWLFHRHPTVDERLSMAARR